MKDSWRQQRGFSLIEILVAVAVIAIGVLGVIALQGATIKTTLDSSQRTSAAAMAEQMIESMRANPSQLAAYHDAVAGAGTYTSSAPSPDCSQAGANCTPAQLVNWDLYLWEYNLMGKDVLINGVAGSGGLIDARGCITVDGNTVTIVVAWRGGIGVADAAGTTGAMACGTANTFRRQHRVQTFISS